MLQKMIKQNRPGPKMKTEEGSNTEHLKQSCAISKYNQQKARREKRQSESIHDLLLIIFMH